MIKPDVIFIGAGPVGLLGAIQLKLECPDKQILMFEKYPEPIRTHAMYIDHDSFNGMNRNLGFGELLDSISSKIQISELEKLLRNYANSIGIEIEYDEIKDFNTLQNLYPDTNYFIGSGGLRGIVHPQVFNNENQLNEALRYAIEVKYKAIGSARKLNKLTEIPAVLSYGHHLVSEYVGHEKNGVTPISLRIFINEDTYQMMKGATFKNPYTLSDSDKINPELFETIQTYLKARKHLINETIQEGSLKISTITLSLYATKEFSKILHGKTIIQIGEEAFACPFYRSFNDNASCIPYFTKSMKALFSHNNISYNKKMADTGTSFLFSSKSKKEKSPLDYYQLCIQKMINSERRVIAILDTGINFLESSVMSSQSAPVIFGSKLSLKPNGKMFLEEMNINNRNEPNESSLTRVTKKSGKFCTIM